MTNFKYPLYKKSKFSGLIVRFDSLNSGTILDVGEHKGTYSVGQYIDDFNSHTSNSTWDDITDKFVISTDIEFINSTQKYGLKFDTGKHTAESIQEDRQDDYGDVGESHDAIAIMWQTYINRKPDNNIVLTKSDVAIMMVLFKACREGYKNKFDNVLDLASYANIALGFEELEATKNER